MRELKTCCMPCMVNSVCGLDWGKYVIEGFVLVCVCYGDKKDGARGLAKNVGNVLTLLDTFEEQ